MSTSLTLLLLLMTYMLVSLTKLSFLLTGDHSPDLYYHQTQVSGVRPLTEGSPSDEVGALYDNEHGVRRWASLSREHDERGVCFTLG